MRQLTGNRRFGLGLAGAAALLAPITLLVKLLSADHHVEAAIAVVSMVVVGSAFARMAGLIGRIDASADAPRDSTRRYRTIFEQSPVGIGTALPGGVIVEANPAVCRMLGYSAEELAGLRYFELIDEEDLGRAYDHAQHLVEKNDPPSTIEMRFVRKDDERVVLRVTRSIVILPEVDARARAAAEASNRAKSAFLSRMSHELRTPLNSILGFAQILHDNGLTEKQRKNVGYILSAGRHLHALVDEVLDISRVESDRLDLAMEPCSVAEIVGECLDIMRPEAAARDIVFGVEAGHEAVAVFADRRRLRQILLNLLSNAVKYNRPGGRVTVGWRSEGREAEVWVSDTGPGFDPQDTERLFAPFDRVGAETTGVEGTGLGLALSRRLAEAMGGSIRAESHPGEGSTFSVQLRREFRYAELVDARVAL